MKVPTLFIYKEHCVMAGRQVPIRFLEEYGDPSECWDWTEVECTEEAAEQYDKRGPYGWKIARTIREALNS